MLALIVAIAFSYLEDPVRLIVLQRRGGRVELIAAWMFPRS
jgi:hypothetical protein